MTKSNSGKSEVMQSAQKESLELFGIEPSELLQPGASAIHDGEVPSTLPSGYPIDQLFLSATDLAAPPSIPPAFVGHAEHLEKDESLFSSGEPFTNLYSVKDGAFKNSHVDIEGDVQITGFSMAGELMGLDAISENRYIGDATSLCESDVWVLSFDRLQELFGIVPSLLQRFNRMMSSEITRQHEMQMLLGTMRAEQRFAVFLVNLSVKYGTLERPASAFTLKMTREDIASYLCLAVETISRLVARFCQNGWLHIDRRNVELLDIPALVEVASGRKRAEPM
ncbi:MAG: helix-turn-helix domain-containing protein [Pseudomonadota bacterium]|nr:helix-turn-helix domain-containing protein [Pseudomonadota bacterium]